MSNNEQEKVTPWKDKAKKYAKIGAVVIFVLWIFTIARGAQDLAQQNEEYLHQPEFEVSYVPGGPKRFKKEFDNFLRNAEKDIEPDKYLWSTLLVKNAGRAIADKVIIKNMAAAPMAIIGYEDLDYGFTKINIKHKTGDDNATISAEALETGKTLKIFIGFNPQGMESPYDQSDWQKWTELYDNYQVKFNVMADRTEETLNLDGIPDLYN